MFSVNIVNDDPDAGHVAQYGKTTPFVPDGTVGIPRIGDKIYFKSPKDGAALKMDVQRVLWNIDDSVIELGGIWAPR